MTDLKVEQVWAAVKRIVPEKDVDVIVRSEHRFSTHKQSSATGHCHVTVCELGRTYRHFCGDSNRVCVDRIKAYYARGRKQ